MGASEYGVESASEYGVESERLIEIEKIPVTIGSEER
jgi:hypothetical protein